MRLLFLLAQQTVGLPPRGEALTVLGIVVGALVLFAASVWWLSYTADQVRIVRRPSNVRPFTRPVDRAALEALVEAPRKIVRR